MIGGSGEGTRDGNACGSDQNTSCVCEHGIMKHAIMYN